ncbi:hypothetical protein [Nakamurella multipartita]|uniref:hypothetical protein n=1 Tax=Nakamurella multipartita TaxID=53461 RepID=UPI0038990240
MAGDGHTTLINHLTQRAVPPPTRRGSAGWNVNAISSILDNPRCTGFEYWHSYSARRNPACRRKFTGSWCDRTAPRIPPSSPSRTSSRCPRCAPNRSDPELVAPATRGRSYSTGSAAPTAAASWGSRPRTARSDTDAAQHRATRRPATDRRSTSPNRGYSLHSNHGCAKQSKTGPSWATANPQRARSSTPSTSESPTTPGPTASTPQ